MITTRFPFPRPKFPRLAVRWPSLAPLTRPLQARARRVAEDAADARLAEELQRGFLDGITYDLWVDAKRDPDTYVVGADGREGHCRTIVVRDRPRSVPAGWVGDLLFGLGGDVQVAVHVEPIAKERAIRLLEVQRVVQHSLAQDRAQAQQLADYATSAGAADATALLKLVQDDKEALFAVAFAFTLRAATREGLDALERRVRTHLTLRKVPVGSTRGQQRAGFLTAGVPYATNHLGRRWTAETTTLAFSVPWLSRNVGTSTGPWIAEQLADGQPVRLWPWATDEGWPAGHGVVPAPNGGGKTVAAGTLLAGLWAEEDDLQIVVVDPIKGDFRRLVTALGGQVVAVGPRPKLRLNPFDLPAARYLSGTGEAAEQNPVLEQTRLATGLLLMMCKSSSDEDEAALEDAVLGAYAGRGIDPDAEGTWTPAPEEVPLLADVVARLEASVGAGAALARKLKRYTIGTLAGLFAGPTNVDVSGRLISFDLERMDPRLRPVGVWLIANWVWQQAKRDRLPRLLYLEEVKTLLEAPETARLVAHLYSLGRAYRLAVWSATQLLTDYTETQEGRRALENAFTVLLPRQAQGAGAAARRYGLDEADAAWLEGCDRGEAVLVTPKDGGGYARVRVDPPPWVLELLGGPAATATAAGESDGAPGA